MGVWEYGSMRVWEYGSMGITLKQVKFLNRLRKIIMVVK